MNSSKSKTDLRDHQAIAFYPAKDTPVIPEAAGEQPWRQVRKPPMGDLHSLELPGSLGANSTYRCTHQGAVQN